MRRLLLLSNTVQHGQPPLVWAADAIAHHFAGCQNVLLVPWALADHDAREAQLAPPMAGLGLQLKSVHRGHSLAECDGIFVPGGNTFRLLRRLQETGLLAEIRAAIHNGTPYMGTSAGSNIACPTICTTNDMPIVQPRDFGALAVVGFQLNPHYLDPRPNDTHQGETRAQRIAEYLEDNDRVVIGVREGGWLRVEGDQMWLEGLAGGVLFRRGHAPQELPIGADLGAWLD